MVQTSQTKKSDGWKFASGFFAYGRVRQDYLHMYMHMYIHIHMHTYMQNSNGTKNNSSYLLSSLVCVLDLRLLNPRVFFVKSQTTCFDVYIFDFHLLRWHLLDAPQLTSLGDEDYLTLS